MRLTAVFIENHRLFEGPKTLNFGGKYSYNSEGISDEELIFHRKKEDKFIDGFFGKKRL